MNINSTIWVSLLIILLCCLTNARALELFASASPFEGANGFPNAPGRLPTVYTRTVCPTRNMSYDIRRTIPIKREDWPILNSTIGPRDPELCANHGIDD